MKSLETVLILVTAIGFALGGGGCGGKSSSAPKLCASCANDNVVLGGSALANGDVAAANGYYSQAVAQDPNNKRAQAGVALTEIYLIQNDSEVQRILQATGPTPAPAHVTRLGTPLGLLAGGGLDWGPRGMTRRLARVFARAATDPVLASDVQNVLKTHVMPRLQDAENRMNVVESDPNFSYPLTVTIGTQSATLEIDRGEIFTLDAIVNGIQGILGPLVAYNFDVENSDYDNAKPDSLLQAGTVFGRLRADGAGQLAAAQASLLLVNSRFDQAVASIIAETDDQSDDVITQADLSSPGFADLDSGINALDEALHGPVTVNVQDYLGNPFPMQIAVSAFFTNPIADLKTKLPAHTFDAAHQVVITAPLTFADPKFNGLFPDMTNARWQALAGSPGPMRLAHR